MLQVSKSRGPEASGKDSKEYGRTVILGRGQLLHLFCAVGWIFVSLVYQVTTYN